MLTKADDYPIHQTPDPIAFAQSDRNFYDRYFFNGQDVDGDLFLAAALGVYPNLNVMDAAFGVRMGERQYNVRASRHLDMERLDTIVGPIRVEVVEPLRRLRVIVEPNGHGVEADLLFEGRVSPIEEPRAVRRNGPRVIQDFTRMTQPGRWTGRVAAGGREIAVTPDRVAGVRDRSWGVRQVGLRDPQVQVPPLDPQFHWLWLPLQFADRSFLFYRNEDGDGEAWNRGAVIAHDDGRVEHLPDATVAIDFHPGTRWPARGVVTAPGGLRVEVEARARFYMNGIGYMDPDWSHGINKGPLAVGGDEIAGSLDYAPPHIYAQAWASATMSLPDGTLQSGFGAFEMLSIGPHARLGFRAMFDGYAP